jgi:hypothetical protein
MKPIPDVAAIISALAADTKSALETKSASALAALEERRHQLLAQHLGFEPRRPIEPVYVLGDSHTLFFAGEDGLNQIKHRRVGFWRPRHITRGLDLLPCFQTRHLGPATAWRAFDYGSSTRSREKIDALVRHELRPGARVLLSFGEVDCRCHIPKRVLAGESIELTVRETVARFLPLVQHLKGRDLQVAVWGPAVVASSDRVVEGDPLPTVGPFDLRAEITCRYIAELSEACDPVNAGCVCLAGSYHNWTQPAEADCFIDGCHLAQKMMPQVLNALKDAGILRLPAKPH